MFANSDDADIFANSDNAGGEMSNQRKVPGEG
jgi:hypothetical protein